MNKVLIVGIFIIVVFVLVQITKKSKNNDITIIGNSDEYKNVNVNKLVYEGAEVEKNTNFNENIDTNIDSNVIMIIDDVFNITGRGVVVTGKIINGTLQVGDSINIRNSASITGISSTVTGIEQFRKSINIANAGEFVGMLLRGVSKDEIHPGDYITK